MTSSSSVDHPDADLRADDQAPGRSVGLGEAALSALRGRSWQEWLLRTPVFALWLVFAQYRHGGDSVVRQHDSLDGYWAVMPQLGLGDMFAPPGRVIDVLLGGLDRGFIGSEFHLGNLLAVTLPVVWALMVGELITRLIAFYGMRWLLNSLGMAENRLIVYSVASLFSILPFYPPAFGAFAGSTLLLASAVRIFDRRRLDRTSVVVLVSYPLISELPFNVPYVIVLLGTTLGVAAVFGRRRAQPILLGTVVFAVASAVAGWRILYSSVFGEPSHRVDMVSERPWSRALWEAIPAELVTEPDHLFVGKSTVLGIMLVAGVLAGLLATERMPRRLALTAFFSMSGILFGTVFARFWPVFESNVVASVVDGWGRLQLNRVRAIEPVLVYVLLAVSLSTIASLVKTWRRPLRDGVVVALGLALVVQGVSLVNAHQFRRAPNSLTISEYYAQGTFAELAAAIESDGGGRVVSVGFHPAVAIFNGIPSADGYWSGYPLEYKERFRRLIAPALEADPSLRSYYDNWGSRVYVFQPDIGRPRATVPPPHEPIELLVSASAFADLGVTHVISSSPVSNPDAAGIELVLEINRSDELGPAYLYRVTWQVDPARANLASMGSMTIRP